MRRPNRSFWQGLAAPTVVALLLVACGPRTGAPASGPAAPAAQPPSGQSSGSTQPSSAAPAKPSGPADKVGFMAGYKAQANVSFVGPYVAQEKGYYREQNLDVEIRHSAQTGEHYKLLAANQIDFTTAAGEDVVKAQMNDGIPMMAIAMITQRGDRGLVALAESGITEPKQWEGKTIGYKGFVTPDYLGILARAGVDRSKLREVSVGYDPRILTEKRVDVLPVFISNEPNLIRKIGYEVTLFDPATWGMSAIGQTWIVNSEQVVPRGPVMERWLRASLRGLEYAFANEQEALDIIMKYAPQEDRSHQEYMLRTERERSLSENTSRHGLGWMTAEQWTNAQDVLLEYDQIKQRGDVTRFFTDQFLRSAYRDGKLIWP